MEPTWLTWIRKISDHATDRNVARRIGVAPSTIGRWREYPPKIEALVELCRAYDAPVADGLVACGYVTRHDLQAPRYERDLRRFTTTEMLTELAQRVTETGQGITDRRPLSNPDDCGEAPSQDDFGLEAGKTTQKDDGSAQ